MKVANGVIEAVMDEATLDLTPHVAVYMLSVGKGEPQDIMDHFGLAREQATILMLLAASLLRETGICETFIGATVRRDGQPDRHVLYRPSFEE